MRNDFCIRSRPEDVTFCNQPLFQFEIIFDDAIVNDDEPARAIAMRVSIFFSWPAVCRPASVADSIFDSIYRCQTIAYLFLECLDPAHGAGNRDYTIIERSDSTRIITPIFEPLQTIDQYGNDIPPTDVSDNSTHRVLLLIFLRITMDEFLS